MKTFLFGFIFLFSLYLYAQDTELNNITMTSHCELYIDAETLNFSDLKKSDFVPISSDYINLGITTDTIWIKIPLKNPINNGIHRYLELENLLFDNIVLYHQNGQLVKSRLLSTNLSQSTLNPTYIIALSALQEETLYLRIQNSKTNSRFAIHIRNSTHFIDKSITEIIKIIFVLGFIMALVFYNMFVFFYTKERTYLYYVFYISTILVQQLSYVGIISILFSAEIVQLSHNTWALQIAMMILSASLYARHFIQTKQHFAKIDKIYLLFITLSIVEVPLFGTTLFYYPQVLLYTGLLFVFFNTFVALYAYFLNNKQARLYALAWVLLFVGYVIIIVDTLGFISIMYKVPNLILYLTGIEALILSLAFSDRYIILEEEKQLSDQLLLITLQNREEQITNEIKTRTQELRQALSNNKVLFKELQHRIKNNLQLIISLIRMQSSKAITSEESEHFNDLEHRIHAISKTHDILYQKEDLQLISMQEYISELMDDYEEVLLQKIECEIEVDAYIQLKEAVYIGIIINEMISNSIKHAFNNDNKKHFIKITLQQEKGTYLLNYKDSGPGFDQEKVSETSLGLSLIKTLVTQQLDGSMLLYSDQETEYIIQFEHQE